MLTLLALMNIATATPKKAENATETKETKDATKATDDKKEETKTIDDLVKDWTAFAGLFDIYQDPKDGKMYLEVDATQLQQKFIYFSQTRDGVLEGGHFRGSYHEDKIFSIEKRFGNLVFVQHNTSFYFDPKSPLYKAKDANISPSVLAVKEIKATDVVENTEETPATKYLIEANDLFLSETFSQIKPSAREGGRGEGFSLGSLSSSKSSIDSIRNYPNNTDIVTTYVFESSHPTNYGSSAITDARNVSIQIHHSLIKLPENDYQPRLDDFRIGYFTQRIEDQTSTSYTPYKDVINRWHLVKKDPSAAISDPVEPIVWWIENTTPLEYRQAVQEGVEAWNIAFEKAGFSNAMVVYQQPDDADWDAGDIGHNVLRWTASPTPPFGGYGPSATNPLTGQLIGADIMLEFVYVNNRYKYESIFQPMQGQVSHGNGCDYGMFHQENLQLGIATLQSQGATEAELTELVEQSIHHLVLHEVGHTLGLNHNMKASQTVPVDKLHDLEWAEKYGLVGSVMDYTPINLAPKGKEQGKFFADKPGTYDLWAIEFGYTPDLSAEQRQAIVSRSLEPMLTFGNDADDMRSSGKAIDPRVNVGDMSGDTVAWATERVQLLNSTIANLPSTSMVEGESFERLLANYNILLRQKSGLASITSRYIGGVYVERGTTEQFKDKAPYTPVPKADQKRAMKFLQDNIFAPGAFSAEIALAEYLQPQRRGYDFFYGTEDPKLHDEILYAQTIALMHILHPTVLSRIEDTALYGNAYDLASVMEDLSTGIFMADIFSNVSSTRAELQSYYITALGGIYTNEDNVYSSVAQAVALANLKRIQTWLRVSKISWNTDAQTIAHKDLLNHKIAQILDTDL